MQKKYLLIAAITLAALLFLVAAIPVPTAEPTPADQVSQAWTLAQASGRYSYNAQIEQTSYPLPSLANSGRQPTNDYLALDGMIDQITNQMDLTLWQDGQTDPNSAIQIKVENGRTLGRVGQTGNWEEINNFTDSFAPGQDPLGFLNAATNIQQTETRTYDFSDGATRPLHIEQSVISPQRSTSNNQLPITNYQYTSYTFTLSGRAYAEHMRQQLEAQLQQYGRLPAGLRLNTADLYRDMSGHGELWIDQNGLPARLIIHMDIPANGETGRAVSTITTTFTNFDQSTLPTPPATSFWQTPTTWLTTHKLDLLTITQQAAITLFILHISYLILLLIRRYWRTETFYKLLVYTLIFTMIIPPLIEAEQAHAFMENMRTDLAEQKARQAEAEAQQKVQEAATTSNWNPHQDPAVGYQLSAVSGQPSAISPNSQFTIHNSQFTIQSTIDDDNDGLSNADEAYWGSDPANPDSDGDTLSDGVEINELGISPITADTDSDGIADNLEVAGFSYNNQTWYSDPTNADSNRDGRLDGQECLIHVENTPSYNPTAACPDSDNDGTPNLFDNDNDNDGVPDLQDLSPDVAGNATYNHTNPLLFSVDNYTVGRPVIFDFQFTPTDPAHLNYHNHILDWPSGDTKGQIQRRLDTTFADTDNLALRSTAANAANGDIRLVPMLEITMPYEAGSYASLPITPTAPATRVLGEDVETWLNNDELDPFAISVSDSDLANGELTAYVPLSQVTDKNGRNVAYTARMVYQPSQATWGADHQYRIVWLVQMLTDECINPEDDPDTCTRQDVLTVAHVYPEEWQLTGANVTVQHGLESAILYEDPENDDNLDYDDQLWMASWNLQNTFMRGRDFNGDNVLDVTVSNLSDQVNNWFSGNNYTVVETFSYPHEAYMAKMVADEAFRILNDTFTDVAAQTVPNLLYVHDYQRQTINLDQFGNGFITNFTPDFNGIDTNRFAAMSWTPYQYVGGEWQTYDAQTYLNLLQYRFEAQPFFDPANYSEEAQASGRLKWTLMYYAALLQGSTALTAVNGDTTWTASVDIPETAFEAIVPPNTFFAAGDLALTFATLIALSAAGSGMSAETYFSLLDTLSAAGERMNFSSRELRIRSHTISFNQISVAIATAAAFAASVAVAVSLFTGDQLALDIGLYTLNAMTAVFALAYVINAFRTFSAVKAATGSFSAVLAAGKSFQGVGVLGLVIGLGGTWGMFVVFVASGGSLSSIAGQQQLAVALVATLILVVLFILDVIGLGVIGILVALIDAILFLFGEDGITAKVIEFLAGLVYDVDYLILNLEDGNRLDINLDTLDFTDPDLGFSAANGIIITYRVTNTLVYNDDYSLSTAKHRSVFQYYLEETEIDHHQNLSLGDMTDEWTSPEVYAIQTADTLSITFDLEQIGAGINQPLPIYLTESLLTSYEGCWFGFAGCTWEEVRASGHIDIGSQQIFDILPAAITEFSSMNWSTTNLPMPAQVDRDNDGLNDLDGTDPNPNLPDADGDTLTDFYEITEGLNPSNPDSDGDGLTDAAELRYNTNPHVADTDGDGLNDRIETEVGWLIIYDDDKLTRVWSDPLAADIDEDSLSDLEEFSFGFNPWVATDASIIDTLVEIDDIGLEEAKAPQLLLHFDEPAASQTFADSSGRTLIAGCEYDNDACPVSGLNGRYGTAVDFDATNDRITLPDNDLLDLETMSLGLWVKPVATSADEQSLLTKQASDGSSSNYSLSITPNTQTVQFTAHAADCLTLLSGMTSTATLTLNEWNHIGLTYDNSQFQLYINGAADAAFDHSGGLCQNGHPLALGDGFSGGIDEVAVFDYAMSGDEMTALMNGRYNPNDLLVAPNDLLRYQATITNTSSTTATGFIVPNTAVVTPSLPTALAAFNFEPADRIATFANDTGEESLITCFRDGTCPLTGEAGRYGNGLIFDGVDDYALFPSLGTHDEGSFNLWVRLDQLPATGERAYILDTESTAAGAVDLYIDDTGRFIIDIAGEATPLSTNIVLPLDSWHNIDFDFYAGTSLRVLWNAGGAHYFQRPEIMRFGNGRLGNSLSGDAPFAGALDAIVFYDQNLNTSTAQPGQNEVAEVRDGTYYLNIDVSNISDKIPVFLAKFDNFYDIDLDTIHLYNSQGLEPMTCFSAATCPTYTQNGQTGGALIFDGIDDTIAFTNTLGTNTLSFWFKLNALPIGDDVVYLMDGDPYGRSDMLQLYVNSSGNVVLNFNSSNDFYIYEGSTDLSSRLGEWIPLTFNVRHLQLREYIDIQLIVDGVDQLGGWYEYNAANVIRFGVGRLGNNVAGTAPLNGMIDEFSYGGRLYDFSVNIPIGGEQFINQVNNATTAECEQGKICPTQTTGVFGDGLYFDYLDGNSSPLIQDPLPLANRSFAVAAWAKRDSTGNSDFIISQGTDMLNEGFHLGFRDTDEFTCAFWGNDLNTPAYTDTDWHHWACTYDATTNGRAIYRDGQLVASDISSADYQGSGPLYLGSLFDWTETLFHGTIDELVILNGATSPEGITYLMNSTYPAIEIPNLFTSFSASALSTATASDTAVVSINTTSSQHTFEQEVEAALELQAQIDYPIIDDNQADLFVFFPFEETPGSTQFDNLASDEEGICADTFCPTAGLRGPVGRAAYFDGIDDALYIQHMATSYPRSLATWVYASQGTIFDNRPRISLDGMQLDMNQLQRQDSQSNNIIYNTLPLDLPKNQWFHLAYAIDGSLATVFVNGTAVVSGTVPVENSLEMMIGSNFSGTDPLHGFLDDLRIYSQPLTAADIQKLYAESAPIMLFDFDDPDGSVSFTDRSVNNFIGQPTTNSYLDPILNQTITQYNPPPGVDGKIGNVAYFDGNGMIDVTNSAGTGNLIGDFALMMWVKTEATDVGLFGKNDGDTSWESGEKQLYLNGSGRPTFVGFGNGFIQSTESVNDGLWHHIAVVWDSTGGTGNIYVDGFDVTGSSSYVANAPDNSGDRSFIGAPNNNEAPNIFVGQLDELAWYGRALSEPEIYSIYLRELRWYRDRATTVVSIDSDAPTIELLSDPPYWPDGYIQLAVATRDTTSRVVHVDLGVYSYAEGEYIWSTAPVCAEATAANGAWCPYFDSTAFSGEGDYPIKIRAIDAVGNETVSEYTLFVDGSAPQVAVDQSGYQPLTENDAGNEWVLSLSGLIEDMDASQTMPLSGVLPNSLLITLRDGRGQPAGTGAPQLASHTNGTWSIGYRFTGQRPLGTYTIHALVTDKVGNKFDNALGTVQVDARPPKVRPNSQLQTQTVFTETTTISGIVVEQPDWGTAAAYHFAPASGANGVTSFDDSGRYANTATCTTTCPNIQVGQFGTAVNFDGSNHLTVADSHTLDFDESFTIALWINPDNWYNDQHTPFVVKGTRDVGAGTTLANYYFGKWADTDELKLSYYNNGWVDIRDNSGANFVDNQWTHVALVVDMQNNLVHFYKDGELLSTHSNDFAARPLLVNDEALTIGRYIGSPNAAFDGQMDELHLFGRALSDGEIYELAQTENQGIQSVELWLDDANMQDSANWQPALITDGLWSFVMPINTEKMAELHLRATDNVGNTNNEGVIWRGLIDNLPPQLHVAAQHVGSGANLQTLYVINAFDFLLDLNSFSLPCGSETFKTFAYEDPGLPRDGQPFNVIAECRVDGHQPSHAFTVCDAAGNCTTVTAVPTTDPIKQSVILNPIDQQRFVIGNTVTINGIAEMLQGVDYVDVQVNGQTVETIDGALAPSVTWSTVWTPAATGTYTLTATAWDNTLIYASDQIVVYVDEVPSAVLNISTAGSGSGTVNSQPAGIACGSDCSETVAVGTQMTLTATADVGSVFTGWSGDVTSTSNPLVVTVDEKTAITANFEALDYTLTVNTTGDGTGSVAIEPQQSSYTYGTVVTLTAVPNNGNYFAGWDGDIVAADNPLVVTMNGDKTITATFSTTPPVIYTLNTTIVGQGAISPTTTSYIAGTVVPLMAVPDIGWQFDSWSGDLSGTDNLATLTMDGNKSITATFSKQSFPLTISTGGDGAGTVTLDPDGGLYEYGTVVTLTAIPAAGSRFDRWEGICAAETTAVCTVTIDQPSEAVAVFTSDTVNNEFGIFLPIVVRN